MDQIKEYLKLAVKYRFWIAVGVAALLPLIGYFATAGGIQEEETKATATIKAAAEGVKKFQSASTPVNKDYEPLVKRETAVLDKDVKTAWRKLYDRQAPLLTWPTEVSEFFTSVGRTWPKELAANVVRDTIMTYIETYEPYWRDVYKVFQPFDPETGEGIVAAPPAEQLLRPAGFDVNQPPTLGKVWNAQEKLWVQRTVLEVIASVNHKAGAKDWLTAAVKQILELEVANDQALDEKSVAQGTTFGELDEIADPNAAPKAEDSGSAASQETAYTAMKPKGGGMSMSSMADMMGGTGSQLGEPDVVKYITDSRADQVYIAPIYLRVYCTQEAIPNLITEFSNSPMNIQVKQVAVYKPAPNSVKRPKKGDKSLMMTAGRGGMGMLGDMMSGGYGGMNRGSMLDMMKGGGGSSTGYGQDMMSKYRQQSRGAQSSGYGDPGYGSRGFGGTFGSQQPTVPKKQGVDVTQETLKKRQQAKDKAKEAEKGTEESESESKAADPFYDVVEVRIWGHARFFKMPPQEETPVSESATGETEPAPADQESAAAPAAKEPTPAAEPAEPGSEPAKPPAEEAMPAEETAPAAPADAPTPPKQEAPPSDTPKNQGTPATEPGSAPAAPGEAHEPAAEPAEPDPSPQPGDPGAEPPDAPRSPAR